MIHSFKNCIVHVGFISMLFANCYCISNNNVNQKNEINKFVRKDIGEWISKLSLSDKTKKALIKHALSEEKTLKVETLKGG